MIPILDRFFLSTTSNALLDLVQSNTNNNNLFEKQQNEWPVPQIVTKLTEVGQDEYRNTLKKK